MGARLWLSGLCVFLSVAAAWAAEPAGFDIDPPHVAEDDSVRLDYDIVYVRSPRWVEDRGQKRPARWAEFAHIFNVTPGSDLVLLRPDGTEEVLVEAGEGAIQDPYVSFDGQWVYYTRFHQATSGPNEAGADIYTVHVKTGRQVRLTGQAFSPNRPGTEQRYGVYNMHPCPVPGGRVAYTSNRNGFLPPPKSYPQVALQLHILEDPVDSSEGDDTTDQPLGRNIETIGHLNLAGALHPVILTDGRLLFSSLENMGLRNYILWAIWSIHPDGTNWAPVVSALHGHSSPSSWHFQTQLSDENIVVELYYNQNQKGFGPLFKLPPRAPAGESAFGPGDTSDPRNPGWDFVQPRGESIEARNGFRIPFTPYGMDVLTSWIRTNDFPAWPSVVGDEKSPRIGKVTHPCGAPDNHLLLAWTLGPIGGSAGAVRDHMSPQPIDSGLYLLKDGKITTEPGQLRLIKNDPRYNEQWPRPVVGYERIYGMKEPKRLEHKNDGKKSRLLPEGTPFGLVGTSSFYKRESAPMGAVEPESVTAAFPKDYRGRSWDPYDSEFTGTAWNWTGQGADAGRYDNADIHAVRILAFEPNAHTTVEGNRYGYPAYFNHAMERLRILGEIPLRKFPGGSNPAARSAGLTEDGQPLDPDGNPDTSFLARLPADVAFTFQTIDKDGMVLNMAQTWHQVRPGEIRNDCGGCHAHSQQPTDFDLTFAARDDYEVFDLTDRTPLVTSKDGDESGKRWDTAHDTGIKVEETPADVEYHRDIRPIFQRSCVACHTNSADKPAGGLVLDDDDTEIDRLPGTYFRLAADDRARFSPRRVQKKGDDQLVVRDLFHRHMASHYIWKFQSRRSPLVWKIYGRRLDGWTNEHVATEIISPDDPRRDNLHIPRGGELPRDFRLYLGDIDHTGAPMPPPEAVKSGKVQPLTDEDRRTIVRWIDLGCPVDLDPNYDPSSPEPQSEGYLADDQRPTLTLTFPAPGNNAELTRILVGMHDYYRGLDPESFTVTADFPLDGAAPGENLASRFEEVETGVWQWSLDEPMRRLEQGVLTVSIADKRGNVSRIERTFSVGMRGR